MLRRSSTSCEVAYFGMGCRDGTCCVDALLHTGQECALELRQCPGPCAPPSPAVPDDAPMAVVAGENGPAVAGFPWVELV